MLAAILRPTAQSSRLLLSRPMSTLPNNKHIRVFDKPSSPSQPQSHILTYLDTDPPSEALSIGTSTTIPPTPQSFVENPNFARILNQVLAEHGHQDDAVISQARAFASPGGLHLGSGGSFFVSSGSSATRKATSPKQGGGGGAGGSGAGGASAQGGAGGAGRGGFVHLGDTRNPPDFGRIAWPEDILGSVEVNGAGEVVGRLVPSGTYRIVTNEGILGLTPFMREKLLSRLKKEEAKQGSS